MKRTLIAVLLALVPGASQAGEDVGFVMGPGQWTCAKMIEVDATGTDIDAGLLAGWLMGYWSAVTFGADADFRSTVERFGGRGIYDWTLAECRKAAPGVQLYVLTQAIIQNTH